MKKSINKVIIGVDLDNTIISYDKVFQLGAAVNGLVDKNCKLNKKDIRNLIRKRPNGEFEWQKLQGYVYSDGIKKAALFPGVYRFLARCRERKIDVEIVSHKTEFGNFESKKISLRESANNFLINHGLLDEKDPLIKKIIYKNSKNEKIHYIKQNKYDYFIDDLEEVLFSNELKDQKGILFSQNNLLIKDSNNVIAKSWEEISQIILGDWSYDEIKNIVHSMDNKSEVQNIERVKGRGNSAIYKLYLSNGSKSALKIYPEISYHNRLKSEFESTKIFNALNIDNVQKPLFFNSNLGIATYEWIEGKTLSKYGFTELKAALSFLSILHSNSKDKYFNNFPYAADSCTSFLDIEKQIKRRLFQFNDARKKYKELDNFLRCDFEPLMNKIISWCRNSCSRKNTYEISIEKDERILSPSDFGFHNAICSEKGKIVFHDFEYFGWDDPVKLISDFSHHAAMNLTIEMEQFWFLGVSEIYGKNLLNRLRLAWPLYGLTWCLIILNEYKDEIWRIRIAADDSRAYSRREHLDRQLNKSKDKLSILAKDYENKHFW